LKLEELEATQYVIKIDISECSDDVAVQEEMAVRYVKS
jgi:hypothetical protein